MINIQRTSESPKSLQSKEIQDYLDGLANYRANPVGEKPQPSVAYRTSDVLEAFDQCFFSKCYLTEKKFANSYAMDIEHFVPKTERPDLRYAWTNLYPADGDANGMKPRKTPEGGYLDPCKEEEDVETEIIYALVEDGREPRFEARERTSQKAVNTANLLHHLHNGSDDNTSKRTETLRYEIKKKYDKLAETIIRWLGALRQNDAVEELEAREELRLMLSRKAAFTMLLRSTPAVRKHIPTDLLD